MPSERSIDAAMAALPGRRVIVRERNARYFKGPASRYLDPPTPMFKDHNITRDEVKAILKAAENA